MNIRHRHVSVAVVYDPPSQGFLLCHNKRWNGYAFPMQQVAPDSKTPPADAALGALDDGEQPLTFRSPVVTPLDHVVTALRSDAARETTVYDYDVFAVDPQAPLPSPLHPDWKLFTYAQLQAAPNVTSSTKEIARSFVDDRRVAVAVLTRPGKSPREFLVTYHPGHGYFFPSTRMKTDAYPPEAAHDAIASDTGYAGPLSIVAQSAEVPELQPSLRFGPGTRRFHYHVCLAETPEVDLTAPGNPLETSLNARAAGMGPLPGPYWQWCTEAQLRNGPNMSPSVSAIILTVLQLVRQRYNE